MEGLRINAPSMPVAFNREYISLSLMEPGQGPPQRDSRFSSLSKKPSFSSGVMYKRISSALASSFTISTRIFLTSSLPIFISLSTALSISVESCNTPSFSRKVLNIPLWEIWKAYLSIPRRWNEWCIIESIS